MTQLEFGGIFWPVSRPEARCNGSLVASEQGELVLELLGEYEVFRDYVSSRKPVRFCGETMEAPVTLELSRLLHLRRRGQDLALVKFAVNWVLLNAHFNESTSLKFRSLRVLFRRIHYWIELEAIDLYQCSSERPDQPGTWIAAFPPPTPSAIETDLGELRLAFDLSFSGDQVEALTVDRHCGFTIDLYSAAPLNEVLRIATSWQSLLTIGTATPVSIEKIVLGHMDYSTPLPDGMMRFDPIELNLHSGHRDLTPRTLYPRDLGPRNLESAGRPRDSLLSIYPEKLFGLNDIGGVDGVASWQTVAREYSSSIVLLMSYWSTPTQSSELRLLLVMMSAEELARAISGKPKLTIRDGLPVLLDELKSHTEFVIKATTSWREEVCDTRNSVAHKGSWNAGKCSETRVRYITESVYLLVILVLLSKAGYAKELLAAVSNHKRFSHLPSQLTYGS